MLGICDSSSISGDNLIIITNDLLITAARNEVTRSMNTNIITSDGIASAFHFIGNLIIITDDFCIAAVNDFIILTGNICVDIFLRICIRDFIPVVICYSVLIRIRDGIPVATCYSRIIRSQYRRISHSTESQQSGDDGSYGRLT